MQDKLYRVSPVILSEQDRWFIGIDYKRFGSGRIFLPDSVKLFDRRAIVTALNPGVGGPELEFGQPRVALDGTDIGSQLFDVDPVDG